MNEKKLKGFHNASWGRKDYIFSVVSGGRCWGIVLDFVAILVGLKWTERNILKIFNTIFNIIIMT